MTCVSADVLFLSQEYLDFVAGISTCALGHANPDLSEAVGNQMKRFHHVSNLYYIPEQVFHLRLSRLKRRYSYFGWSDSKCSNPHGLTKSV